MENIITPRSEIKVASQSEINRRKILARTEYETRKLTEALENIDFQIKYNAEKGRKWFLHNPWCYSFGDEYLPYKDIYEDIINELTYKGYIAKRHKVFLSNKDLISVIIKEDARATLTLGGATEFIDINELEIKKHIKDIGKTNLFLGLLSYGFLAILFLLFIALFASPLIVKIN